ncbi:MAG: hypothetical protein JNK05_31790 [Myxococcales bacterium]|nr:hypothetical protein [Myxococcales bacterium]
MAIALFAFGPSVACTTAAPQEGTNFDRCGPVYESDVCWYFGYGTTCTKRCSVGPECQFELRVAWMGNEYCCDTSERVYHPCECREGVVYCAAHPSAPRSVWKLPTSTCEFCRRPDVYTVDRPTPDATARDVTTVDE